MLTFHPIIELSIKLFPFYGIILTLRSLCFIPAPKHLYTLHCFQFRIQLLIFHVNIPKKERNFQIVDFSLSRISQISMPLPNTITYQREIQFTPFSALHWRGTVKEDALRSPLMPVLFTNQSYTTTRLSHNMKQPSFV